jgi:hypothetical protein
MVAHLRAPCRPLTGVSARVTPHWLGQGNNTSVNLIDSHSSSISPPASLEPLLLSLPAIHDHVVGHHRQQQARRKEEERKQGAVWGTRAMLPHAWVLRVVTHKRIFNPHTPTTYLQSHTHTTFFCIARQLPSPGKPRFPDPLSVGGNAPLPREEL